MLQFSLTHFWQKFREINFLLKNFTLNWFDEKNFHGSEFLVFPQCDTQNCGNYDRSFSAMIFSQKFCQINALLKNFTINRFDGKNSRGSEILVFPHTQWHTLTVWKLRKFSLTLFSQKFRESNCFTKEITTLRYWIDVPVRVFFWRKKNHPVCPY